MKLFASDIDNTLIPQKKEFFCKEDILYLQKILNGIEGLKIAYLSGRRIELILEVLPFLPPPSFLVADVGTSLYFLKNNNWEKDKSYEKYLLKSKYNGKEIEKELKNIEGLFEQEEEAQNDFKLSYYLEMEYQEKALSLIKKKVDPNSAKIIYSKDNLKGLGLIDIIPQRAGKAGALNFLANKMGLKNEDIIYAGDSGNDMDIFDAGFKSIIVGNASLDLKNSISLKKKNVYIAKKHFSKGIVEGIKNSGFISPKIKLN